MSFFLGCLSGFLLPGLLVAILKVLGLVSGDLHYSQEGTRILFVGDLTMLHIPFAAAIMIPLCLHRSLFMSIIAPFLPLTPLLLYPDILHYFMVPSDQWIMRINVGLGIDLARRMAPKEHWLYGSLIGMAVALSLDRSWIGLFGGEQSSRGIEEAINQHAWQVATVLAVAITTHAALEYWRKAKW